MAIGSTAKLAKRIGIRVKSKLKSVNRALKNNSEWKKSTRRLAAQDKYKISKGQKLKGKAKRAVRGIFKKENWSYKAGKIAKSKRASRLQRLELKTGQKITAGYENRTSKAFEKGAKLSKARKEQETLSGVAGKIRRHLAKYPPIKY